MPSTIYAGGLGCFCCDNPCNICFPCPALTASNYCFCITRLVLTQIAGACESFDYTLDPPLCIGGTCCAQAICMSTTTTTIYKLPDGRTLEILSGNGGSLSCEEFGGVKYYSLNLILSATLYGCPAAPFGEVFIDTVVSIASTQAEAEPCDETVLFGTHIPSFLNINYGLDVHCSFGGGGC